MQRTSNNGPASQRQRLDFVVRDDDEARGGVGRAAADDAHVRHRRFVGEDLDLLDDDGPDARRRVVRFGVEGADDFALVCKNARPNRNMSRRSLETSGTLVAPVPMMRMSYVLPSAVRTCGSTASFVNLYLRPPTPSLLRCNNETSPTPSSSLPERGVRQQRQTEEGRHRFVHQRVRLDEAERQFGQLPRVVGAVARPRFGHLGRQHRQPKKKTSKKIG